MKKETFCKLFLAMIMFKYSLLLYPQDSVSSLPSSNYLTDIKTSIITDTAESRCLTREEIDFEVTLAGFGSGIKNVYGQNFTQHMNYDLTVDFIFEAHSPIFQDDLIIYSLQLVIGTVHHWGTAVDHFLGTTTTLHFDYTHIYEYSSTQGTLEFSVTENEIIYIGFPLPYTPYSNKFTPYYLQFADPDILPIHIMNFGFWMFNHEYIIEGSASGLEAPDQFTSELHWIDTSESNPIGVCADGSAVIILRILHEIGNSPINQIRIQLTDGTGTNTHPLGTIGTSVENATGSSVVVDNPSGNDFWDFFYVAPDVFTNNVYNQPEREVIALIEVDCEENGVIQTNELSQAIKIIRPPVLLIHGLKSNWECFSILYQDLISSGRYNDALVYTVDYRETHDKSFYENRNIVEANINFYIASVKSAYTCEVKKVDLVGHSMGGILSRIYLQSPSYKNNINKLITVNTPHTGSQGANLLWALPESVRKFIGFNGLAVRDLRVNSDANCILLNGDSNLNANIAPSHSINTSVLSFAPFYPIFRENLFAVSLLIAARIEFPHVSNLIELFPALLYGEPNDLVVPVGSQIGGLSINTGITNEWHNGAPKNIFVRNRILELLESPPSGSLFSTSGFDPPACQEGYNKDLIRDSISFSLDSVIFLAPTPGTAITNGQDVLIDITGSLGIHSLMIFVKTTYDSVFFLDTLASSLTLNYTVSQTAYGKIKMLVIGVDTVGNIAVDSTFINIQTNAIPLSIFVTYPPDSLVLSQGFYGSVYVSCLFSDSIIRDITTSPQVQYSLKTNNAEYVRQGVFKGVQQGLDTVVIEYSTHTLQLPVYIGQFFVQMDTVFINDTICFGESYLFYDEILTESGIYDTTFTNMYGCDSLIVLNLSVLVIPPAPDHIFGPTDVYQGQTDITYSVELLSNASSYQWTLPPGMEGSSNTNYINVNLKPNSYSGYLKVFGYNLCGNGISDSIFINVEMAEQLFLNNNNVHPVDSTCFNALETIIVAGNNSSFNLSSGKNITLIAGENILILENTQIESGAYLHAYITIDSNYCINQTTMFERLAEPKRSNNYNELLKNKNFFILYPNPTPGIFTLEIMDTSSSDLMVEIYTIMGERILVKELEGSKYYHFDLSEMARGIYLVRVIRGDEMGIEKVIRQ